VPRQPSEEMDDSQSPPRWPIPRFMGKREGIEPDRRSIDLSTKIDHSGHLGRLRFIAISAVGICQRCAGLHANTGYYHSDNETDP